MVVVMMVINDGSNGKNGHNDDGVERNNSRLYNRLVRLKLTPTHTSTWEQNIMRNTCVNTDSGTVANSQVIRKDSSAVNMSYGKVSVYQNLFTDGGLYGRDDNDDRIRQ